MKSGMNNMINAFKYDIPYFFSLDISLQFILNILHFDNFPPIKNIISPTKSEKIAAPIGVNIELVIIGPREIILFLIDDGNKKRNGKFILYLLAKFCIN